MGLHEAVDEVETEPGATAAARLPELGEHPAPQVGVDALALVLDDQLEITGPPSRVRRREGDPDRAGAVPDGVLDEVRDDLDELVGIDGDLGQVGGDVELDGTARARADRLDHPPDQDLRVHRARVQLEPAGVDACDVEQLGDESAEPVGVGADGREHELLLVVVELVPAIQQRLHEALHAGQRGPQLVGDGGDEVGPLPVQAGPAASGPDADGDPADGFGQRHAVQAGDHQHLGAVGQQPGLLRHRRAGREPVVGVVGRAPVPTVLVPERQDLDEGSAVRITGVDAQPAGCHRVDVRHPARCVGDDDAVGEEVQAVRGHAITLDGRSVPHGPRDVIRIVPTAARS